MLRFTTCPKPDFGRFAQNTNGAASPAAILLFIVVFVLFLNSTVSGVTFSGANVGAIPDGGSPTPTCGAPLNITFAVSGINSPIGSVSVNFTMNPTHTWVGDLKVSLIAPNTTTHLLFSRVGATTATGFGDDANLGGTYTFNNTATGNIWTAAASDNNANFIIPPGGYRTKAAGPAGNTSPGPPFTSLSGTFASLPAAARNGTWTLRFEDCSVQDIGTVSAAGLTLLGTTAADVAVSGRVTTADGAGIRHASISVTGGNLAEPVNALSGAFGYYRFEGLEAGQTYILTIKSKRYVFSQPVIVVTTKDGLSEVNFVADPSPF